MGAVPTSPNGSRTPPRNRGRNVVHSPRGEIAFDRDAWGYPRIRVRDHREAAWVMGYLHATDRLLQVRLQLMAAQGRTMAVLGDQPLTRTVDRSVRTVGLTAGLDDQVAGLSEATLRFGESYCAGFNAGARHNARARDLLARSLGLPAETYELRDVLTLYRLTTWFGLNSITQTNALVMALLASSFADNPTIAEDLRLLWGDASRDIDFAAMAEAEWPAEMRDLFVDHAPRGSNAFAVSGQHTASGSPLMMSEFHLEVGQLPPLLYAVHVDIGDDGEFFHGVSIPGLPTITAGRNRQVAWTYTFGHAANVDVWLERCKDGRRVTPDGDEALIPRHETVEIRDGALGGANTERWTFWDCPHGTIVGDPVAGGTFPAVQWRGLERTYADMNALLEVPLATSVDALVDAHRRVQAASLAGTFIDRAGHIGYAQTGNVRRDPQRWGPRRGWCDPDGQAPEDNRPHRLDPPEGFIASANEHHDGWTAFAEPPYRYRRMSTLLAARIESSDTSPIAPDELIRISYDEHDGLAEHLARAWSPYLADFPEAQPMLQWAQAQSATPSKSERQHRQKLHALHRETIRLLLVDRFDRSTAAWLLRDPSTLLGFHHHLDPVLMGAHDDLLPDPARRDLVRRAWAGVAVRDATPGADTPVIQRIRFRHVLEGGLKFATPLSGPEIELPGGPVSLFQMRASMVRGRRIVTGPAFHLLIDMSSNVTRYNIAGGASEFPLGPGYASGIEAWRDSEFLPLGG